MSGVSRTHTHTHTPSLKVEALIDYPDTKAKTSNLLGE